MSACVRDQIAWARFHLGDGTAEDGTRLLSKESIDRMQEPTILNPLGEGFGISWAYHPYGDARLIEHGGDTIGQHSSFSMYPEARFAVTSLTNCGPNGSILNEELTKWAYETYTGLVDSTPEPVDVPAERLADYVGTYETIAVRFSISAEPPRMRAAAEIQPETIAQMRAEGMDPPDAPPPFEIGMVDGPDEVFVVTDEGAYQGMQGYFVRDESGKVSGLFLSRLATKTS
jgi:hypothetical protein